MEKDRHSVNAQVRLDTYNTFVAIVKKDKKSSVNSYLDNVIEDFNERWKRENPEKAKQLKQWIKDVEAKKNNAA